MDILKSSLVTIFKEQDPFQIIKNTNYIINSKPNNYNNLNKRTFVDLCMQIDKQASQDEIENLYEIICKNMRKSIQGYSLNKSVFNLLINYSENMFENYGNNVKCRYKDLLKWRMTSLKLDSDMFICAYLAYKDILIGCSREYFDWDTIIKSNNVRVHNMLSEGIAENHFHLKGSAPIFKLSWISLMNDLNNRNTNAIKIDKEEERLEKDLSSNINLKDAIVVAALIRVMLFKKILNENINVDELANILNEVIDTDGNCNSIFISMNSSKIQSEINSLKYLFGADIEYKNNQVKVDYALLKKINREDKSTRLFLGERYFMYECFKRIYSINEEFLKYANYFYAYLIIKNKVRAELIQLNDKVGFSNFANYQDRKTKYLKDNTVLKDFVEPSAILTSIKNQNMLSIEARIIPSKSVSENVNYIQKIDNIICNHIYNDRDNFWYSSNSVEGNNDELSISMRKILKPEHESIVNEFKNRFFYVYHFPKERDKQESVNKNDYNIINRCRHHKYRQDLREWGNAIYLLRQNHQQESKRVLGIDACSSEIVTRPEVFGQVFRFLKHHIPSNGNQGEFRKGDSLPRLRATYHVGEDFLDCVDGLRAIDESILFLEMTHGDRLGHAIALGIDIEEWYKKKRYRVHLSKQEILDNVAWLIMKLKEFQIDNASEAIDKLTAIYNKYYSEIYINEKDNGTLIESIGTNPSMEVLIDYIKNLQKNNNIIPQENNTSIIPVDSYMEAWKLRGDNPEAYLKDNIIEKGISYWDRCAKRENSNKSVTENIKNLYVRYHYDPKVKAEGYKKEVFKIEPYIINAAKKVQRCMQDYIRQCGIAIECNPSSNVCISTFERYDKHPILSLYNLGLKSDLNESANYPQMFVSINTDDQGVFDTLIENEFALMAIALEKAKDKDGNPLYNQSMIYDWLDRVRKMGIEQSFNTNISKKIIAEK